MTRKFVFALVVAGLLAACGESKSYPLSAHDITSRLLATKPPMSVFGSSGGTVMVTQGDGDAVRWTVLQGGKQVMRLVATVTPDGDSASSVAVSVEPPDNKAGKAIGKNVADDPAIVKLYRSAMVEQIDARLNNREFDMGKIQGEMVAVAVATMPKIQQSAMQAAQNSAQMDHDARQRAADEAYEREQRSAMSGYTSNNPSQE